MSKARNKRKPPSSHFHVAWGISRSVSIWPTTSSMTTWPGSMRPKNFSASPAAQTPITKSTKEAAARTALAANPRRGRKPKPTTRATPTSEPAVPGAMGKYPAPPAVAIQMAGPARGLVKLTLCVCAVVLGCTFLIGIERSRDAIPSFQPIIEVNHLASLATKRTEYIVFPSDALFTDWATHVHDSG